jgi:hypothetical protein
MPYMIRNGQGLFSTGGGHPSFREDGKMWKTLGQVKSHLAMFRTYQGVNQVPADWEVVEVQLKLLSGENARALVQPLADKQAERQAQYKNRFEKERADREKAEFKRLQKKYDPAHAPGHE